MKFEFNISTEEAVNFLRSFGLMVERCDTPTTFYNQHKNEHYEDVISTWVVANPHAPEQRETVEDFMRKLFDRKAKTLFLQADKIEIFTLFKTK